MTFATYNTHTHTHTELTLLEEDKNHPLKPINYDECKGGQAPIHVNVRNLNVLKTGKICIYYYFPHSLFCWTTFGHEDRVSDAYGVVGYNIIQIIPMCSACAFCWFPHAQPSNVPIGLQTYPCRTTV